jgi:CxxC motif-containing protein (DUF1111 family)
MAQAPPAAGLEAAFLALDIDALARAWDEVLTAPAPGELGGPALGLDWRQLIEFYDGRLAFKRVFTAADGLGPTYNDVSCASCHSHPVIGGGGAGPDDAITVHGPPWTEGDAMGLRKHAIAGREREVAAGKTATLRTPPLFGLGLLDAVPEAAREAREDPDDRDGDGIRGVRGFRHGDGVRRPSRFGQKANDWDLLHFSAGAMVDEMGVTNAVRRDPRGDDDGVSDPEVDAAFVLRVYGFVRYLGRPQPLARDAEAERGAARFEAIGCTGCHAPSLGDTAGAYTDLLLHDMGPALDSGIKDGVATGSQWRTAPLWGFRFRKRYLHDDRAADLDAVLAHHGGEAARPAQAYRGLPSTQRAAILAFLRTL